MKPLMVEVIAYAPTQYYHCQHCEVVWNGAKAPGVETFHQESFQSSIPPELMHEYQAVSDWVRSAVEQYEGRVVFKVIDAASFEGLLKSVRYGVRHYPAVVIDGKDKHTGSDFQEAEKLISRRLQAQPAS